MKENFESFKKYIKGKKTAVVGIGVSNTPLIYFLVKLGANVTAFDKKQEKDLGGLANDLKTIGVDLVLGENYLDKLFGYEVIFKTPSMRIDLPMLVKAKKDGAYITSEMEEFIKYCPGKIFGVTGSDGKTTTTTIIYNLLKEQGYKTYVGGNIGMPLFSNIEDIKEEDKIVLELSSFQLMTISDSVDVAIVTNLSPNHLDIHKDMDEYIDSKKNIYRFQTKDDTLILNKDNDITYSMEKEAKGKVLFFSRKDKIDGSAYLDGEDIMLLGEKVISRKDIKIKGLHNVENLLAAYTAVKDEVSIDTMRRFTKVFNGVEHRCEFIREFNGIRFYNDSIASSPTRTLAGLKAFEKPVILIAGGYDKNIPFDVLAYEGINKIKSLILIGDTKYKIYDSFSKVMKEKNIKLDIFVEDNLDKALNTSLSISKEGDIVTLSP
ncbi:MAG: UDP-N-acetylmuramoyl-L-alanine--D-glutamate ligase, partial [Clostridiaceae bacterium]